MSVNIKEFNSKAYDFLKDLRKKQPDLRYTYRKSNYGGRLEEGFWFYGNDNYFCVSFWTGMDWKNRTPNISFFLLANGEAQLEVNVSDSDRKRQFVEKHLVNQLDLSYDGRRYIKRYGIEEYAGIEFLDLFINGFEKGKSDKEKIDLIIAGESKLFFENDDNRIDFIGEQEFKVRDIKIKKYIELQDQEKREQHDAASKPSKLHSLVIRNYQDIKEAGIDEINQDVQWIFLTGENGSGKTSVLKAIATILGYRIINKKEIKESAEFEASLNLYKGKDYTSYRRHLNEGCNKRFPIVSALAIFGPNRLITNKDTKQKNSFDRALKKEGMFYPLWDYDYRMLDIEEQFNAWRKDKKDGSDELEKRIYYIRTLLSRIVPGLYDIRFEKKDGKSSSRSKNKFETQYIVRESDSALEETKYWQQLPSGTRSVFAMSSELLIRLYHFQKDIIDPSELKGIVIIDEIDLHLHPNAQRQLVIDLTETFRSVQFIVATHSPIPLLGAPKGSVFIKITREPVEGIKMERLYNIEKDIGNFLPNVLYTSSVFGMSNMISVANNNKSDISTQANYEDAIHFSELKEKLKVHKIEDADYLSKLKKRLNN